MRAHTLDVWPVTSASARYTSIIDSLFSVSLCLICEVSVARSSFWKWHNTGVTDRLILAIHTTARERTADLMKQPHSLHLYAATFRTMPIARILFQWSLTFRTLRRHLSPIQCSDKSFTRHHSLSLSQSRNSFP